VKIGRRKRENREERENFGREIKEEEMGELHTVIGQGRRKVKKTKKKKKNKEEVKENGREDILGFEW